MGRQYQAALEAKLSELGPEGLRVFVNPDAVDPRYQEHLQDTFTKLGVHPVTARSEAEFVFEGHGDAVPMPGQVVAYLRDGHLTLVDAIQRPPQSVGALGVADRSSYPEDSVPEGWQEHPRSA